VKCIYEVYGLFMEKSWQIIRPDIQVVKNVCSALNCSPVLATILVNREINSPEKASSFFNSSFKEITPPFSIKDMDLAVKRIHSGIKNKEKILIFGDYDVDGVTATSILYQFLKYTGADVSFYIPHRIDEGYGLETDHITRVALPKNIKLIVTVDCGTSSHDAVEVAKTAGIDVIITDHHNISDKIPDAYAVVNPKRSDCTSGLEGLAGVGVAFYLLICLRKCLRDNNFWDLLPEPNLKDICDLVALGTIADIVPLVAENRIFTKAGLEVISSGKRPGIRSLITTCKINKPLLGSEDIAFKLAPRLNAAGRVGHANAAVDILTESNPERADTIAYSLNRMNIKRQKFETQIFDQILDYLKVNPNLLQKKALVLAEENWHEGVIGIVASKMVKKFSKPVILISIRNGIGKGSARSIPEFDLYNGLVTCSDELESFGGHKMAAGLRIKIQNIKSFRKAFEDFTDDNTMANDFRPKLMIDYELRLDEITDKLIDEIETMQPFGASNHEPLFLAKNVEVKSSSIVGKSHRRMLLCQPSSRSGKKINAIWFNVDPCQMSVKYFKEIVFRLQWNHWNDKKTPQIIVEAV
jgi:single-stranded-DNA-specific exonuclease